MLKEFKAFIFRGNVIDLAVAVIIAAAIGAIISSLIEDIITPLLLNPALKAAHVDNIAELRAFGTLVDVKDAAGKVIGQKVEGGIAYGAFLSKVINFVIVAFVLFLMIKGVNKAMSLKKKKEETPAAPTPENIELLREIRDSLKK